MASLRRLRSFVRTKLFRVLVWSTVIFIFNEWLIYYVVISQCSLGKPETFGNDYGHQTDENGPLKAMILADTHLLGPRRGHWFDKLRREWQMHRAFQTSVTLFSPEVIFILGDVFDEGLWVDPQEFQDYVARFHSLFEVDKKKTALQVVVGNHDIGFHYVITPYLNSRFQKAFNTSSIKWFNLKGINFILVNSMAMKQDGCFLCSEAMTKLHRFASELECQTNPYLEKCQQLRDFSNEKYSAPILLQHFPMYRKSDKLCSGDDAAPEVEKESSFRENWECLSSSSTQLILQLINPRLVMSGHTHHGCQYHHKYQDKSRNKRTVMEYSVPSFSWRNRDNPSFYLALFYPNYVKLEKCKMPKESTVKFIYAISFGYLTLDFLCKMMCHGSLANVIYSLVRRLYQLSQR